MGIAVAATVGGTAYGALHGARSQCLYDADDSPAAACGRGTQVLAQMIGSKSSGPSSDLRMSCGLISLFLTGRPGP